MFESNMYKLFIQNSNNTPFRRKYARGICLDCYSLLFLFSNMFSNGGTRYLRILVDEYAAQLIEFMHVIDYF